MADGTWLLLAMALGATAVLAARRLSRDDYRSMLDSSTELARMAQDSLQKASETALAAVETASRLEQRDRALDELTATVAKLDATVGNLYLSSRQQSRTILERPIQVGEMPPGSPGIIRSRTQEPLPPEGLAQETVPGSSPAAESTRQRAFAVPT